MCGISGSLINRYFSNYDSLEFTKKTTRFMENRGPDFEYVWKDKNCNVSLGHRRLSIIDLDKRSNQPMFSNDGRFVIVFNGEIYNFKELKNELVEQNVNFKTYSDTEVILELFVKEGIEMVHKLRGMFSFAIWDTSKKDLFLVRDPYGIKPLYYSYNKFGLFFASQVKALLEINLISKDIDNFGKTSFFLFGSVSEPNTWFNDIKSLKSGHYIKFNYENNLIKTFKYLDITKFWQNNYIQLPKKKLYKKIKEAITKSVKYHLISDVQIGILLSGGVDSGIVLSIINDLKIKNIKAITVNFDEFKYTKEDEVPIAKKIADFYNIEHIVETISYEEFKNDFTKIIHSMDSPSVDGINIWYACKIAKKNNIKVLISGLGGDELFFGYPSFRQIPIFYKLFKIIRFIFLLKIVSKLINFINIFLKKPKLKNIDKTLTNIFSFYWIRRGLFSIFEVANLLNNRDSIIKSNIRIDKYINQNSLSSYNNLSTFDVVAQLENQIYLKNQLLKDSDWASMYHSIELRTPLVDTFLTSEISGYIPRKYNSKNILKDIFFKGIDSKIFNKKKTGFGIPVFSWLKKLNNERNYILQNKYSGSRYIALIFSKLVYYKNKK